MRQRQAGTAIGTGTGTASGAVGNAIHTRSGTGAGSGAGAGSARANGVVTVNLAAGGGVSESATDTRMAATTSDAIRNMGRWSPVPFCVLWEK
jgi:hypothetical protein